MNRKEVYKLYSNLTGYLWYELPSYVKEKIFTNSVAYQEGDKISDDFYPNHVQNIKEILRYRDNRAYPNFDLAYFDIMNEVIEKGILETDEVIHNKPQTVRGKYVTDDETAPTKRILNRSIRLDNSGDNALVLTSKKHGLLTPIREMYWIWIMQSNVVQKLRDMNCNIWNEWEIKNKEYQEENGYSISNGTIGKAYGYQIGTQTRKVDSSDSVFRQMCDNKEVEYVTIDDNGDAHLNQLDYLIYQLRKNPLSRRIKTTLYNISDLDEMALEPCVYETHWQTINNTLELTVNIRSNDMPLGHVFNVYQYAVLHKAISQVVGIPTGDIVFNIDNVHIYERHIPEVIEQLKENIVDLVGTATMEIADLSNNIYNFNPNDSVKITNYNAKQSRKFEIVY